MTIKKEQFISDLKIGENADSVFAVARKQVKKKKNGDMYCTVTLQDKKGSVEGVLWTEIYNTAGNFNQGDFVSVRGDVKEYRGSRQLVISSIRKIENKEDLNFSDYVKTTGRDIDEMFSEITEYISRIENPHLRKLMDMFFGDKKFVKDFKNATAAVKYHHAFRGGLLEHTLSVTKICDILSGIYNNLNYDLLISGAILHDIGKMREYRTAVNTEVTDEGKLIGHITIGYGLILEKIKQIEGFPADLKNRLLHIILSHHGQKEFGSPKQPKIPEAFIVYHVDYLDADIGGYNIILEENKNGADWSDYVKNFERSVLLREVALPDYEEGAVTKKAPVEKIDVEEKQISEKDREQDELF